MADELQIIPEVESADSEQKEEPTVNDETKQREEPTNSSINIDNPLEEEDVDQSTSFETSVKDPTGLNGELLGWENHKLLLTLALAQGIEESGIHDEHLCAIFEESNQVTMQKQQPMPLTGMMRKIDDHIVIKLDNQTRAIEFGDKIVQPDNYDMQFGVVSSVEKFGENFKVQLHQENSEISSNSQQIVILPFSIGSVSKICKITPRTKLIEEWMAVLSNRTDLREADAEIWNKKRKNAPVIRILEPTEKYGGIRFQENNQKISFDTFVASLRESLKKADPLQNQDCPTALTNGKCIDTSFVKNAGRDQDIRSYELFSNDIRELFEELSTNIGEQQAQELCQNLNPEQSVYEEVMRNNATVWTKFAKENRAVKETLHFFLLELITFCVNELQMGYAKTKRQKAAILWLRFYISMPSFFCAMSLYLWNEFKNIDQNSLKHQIPFIMRYFYDLLSKNLNGVFLPPKTIIHDEVNAQFLRLRQELKRFKFLPRTLIA